MHPNLTKNYSEKLSLKVLGKNHTLLIYTQKQQQHWENFQNWY